MELQGSLPHSQETIPKSALLDDAYRHPALGVKINNKNKKAKVINIKKE